MTKKILIAYATAGVGHKKAALAIEQAFKNVKGDFEVKIIDVLDYSLPWFKKWYPESYVVVINKMIWLWRILYYFNNIPIVYKITLPFRKWSHRKNCNKLSGFVENYRPDVVLSTHFILPDICAFLKKQGKCNAIVYNVITDYRDHSFWISDGADKYCVGHQKTKDDLVNKWGINSEDVYITGIPVEPKFLEHKDREQIRKDLCISVQERCILVLSGGYGMGPLFEMVQTLEGLQKKMTVICICGHNKELHDKVNTLKGKLEYVNLINLGYINNVDELMAASDIYLGKAGGISSSEALVMGLPMIFVRPIPGQESRNAELLVSSGAALEVKNLDEIGSAIKFLLEQDNIDKMKQAVQDIRKPNAASDIVKLALGNSD